MLYRQTNRFANLLQQLGIGKQDRVFLLTGRIPELYIATLGTWKNTSVVCPLFSAFGPEPLQQRLSKGDAKVLVTTGRFYQKKIQPLFQQWPGLRHVLLVDVEKDINAQVLSLSQHMEIKGVARQKLGSAVAPKEIEFRDQLLFMDHGQLEKYQHIALMIRYGFIAYSTN